MRLCIVFCACTYITSSTFNHKTNHTRVCANLILAWIFQQNGSNLVVEFVLKYNNVVSQSYHRTRTIIHCIPPIPLLCFRVIQELPTTSCKHKTSCIFALKCAPYCMILCVELQADMSKQTIDAFYRNYALQKKNSWTSW